MRQVHDCGSAGRRDQTGRRAHVVVVADGREEDAADWPQEVRAVLDASATLPHPRAAALQGLDKMQRLSSLGIAQFLLPPHPRPQLAFLRQLGFEGNDFEVIIDLGKVKSVKKIRAGFLQNIGSWIFV